MMGWCAFRIGYRRGDADNIKGRQAMKQLTLALTVLLSWSAGPALAGAIILDLSAVVQRPVDLAEMSDGTVLIGGQTMDANPADRSGQLVFVNSDLSGFTTQRTGSFGSVETNIMSLSNNGDWFGAADASGKAIRGETSDPIVIEDLGHLGVNMASQPRAIDSLGTTYGVTAGGATPFYVTVGGAMQGMPGSISGAITGTSDNTSLQIGLGANPNSSNNLHPALWTKTEFRGFLPGYTGEGNVFVTAEISPNGTVLGSYRNQVTFDPDTFELTETPFALYYVDLDGIITADQSASDYTRVAITDAGGNPFVGTTRAVTDLVHGWIGGHTGGLPEFGETEHQAWIMNVNTMTSPVLVKDWLFGEYGLTLPHDPKLVRDLHVTADGQLLILLDGSTFLASVPVGNAAAVPEPSTLTLCGLALGGLLAAAYRRRRQHAQPTIAVVTRTTSKAGCPG